MMELFKNACGYAPLLVNCEGYWDLPLDELPAELKQLVQDNFFLFPWDTIGPANRRSVAAQNDYQHDAQYEPSVYFKLSQLQDDVNGWLSTAKADKKDSAIVVLRDVADGVEAVLAVDRDRVGTEIQLLRMAASQTPLVAQQAVTAATERPLAARERDSLLNIIGGMLELLQDQRPMRADTSNQSKIIEALLAAYSDKNGISERNLQAKFAEAKRALERP